MDARRIISCLSVPFGLAMVLAALWGFWPPRVDASLYGLIGERAARIPRFLREASASEVAVVVSSPDAAKAVETAKRIGTLPGAGSGDLPPGAFDFIRENRGGLVTHETAELLRTERGRMALARCAVRRLFRSPVPPLLGYADDPFGLTDAFLLSLSGSGRKTVDGYPLVVTNGVTRILVRFRIDRHRAEDLDGTIATCTALEDEVRRMAAPGVEVCLTGAPVHASVSAAKSRTEIGILTWFSLFFIAGLSLVVFRTWKWIPFLAGSLAVSAMAGALALVVAFREVHVLTFVMGTTVLGLVIDYSFHWLLSSAADKPQVRRDLFVSFLTTEISLVPLMLATIPVLRQSALFLGVGLAAAFGYVSTAYPVRDGRDGTRVRVSSRVCLWLRGVSVLAFLALAAGLANASVRTEIAALYRPPAGLLEAERLRASFGTFDFSAVPPLAERRRIAADVRRLYAEQGSEMAKTLQVDSLTPPPEPTDCLMHPQALMAKIFDEWTTESLCRLAFSTLALIAALLVMCRRRAVRMLMPPLTSLLAIAGLLGWLGTPINVFHILAGFLLLGMGVDYAVFLQSGRAAFRPALCSLLTSMAGFGALAFVSFPVVASFGVVLGAGLPIAFVSALVCRRDSPAASAGGIPPLSAERGASPAGLEILWLIYRAFGLRFLHAAAACTGACVWTFSGAVRRASPSLRKVVCFTRSLADKLVVMAEGEDLPHVETDGSDDAAAFLSDVRAGKGVFILSSHCGTVETLVALGDCPVTFHAWMDFDRTSVFNRFYLHHVHRQRVVIHPVSGIGMETAFLAGEALDRGDCLVMAGDRGRGAFRFARALGHPVYFAACVWADGGYRAIVRRLPADTAEMERRYEGILKEVTSAFPDQSFTWER